MKAKRISSMLLCALMLVSLSPAVSAADGAAVTAAEQHAAELSRYTFLPYYRPENTQRYMDYRAKHPEHAVETVITYVNIGLDRSFYVHADTIENPAATDVLVNKYHALPPDFVPPKLEPINSLYSVGVQRLNADARAAFDTMCADAKKLGYALYATSAYRSYDRQAEVYAGLLLPGEDNTVTDPDLVAARPGFSEHQTGLAVDVIHALVKSNAELTQSAVYKWYTQNAHKYGFIIRYPEGCDHVTGYAFEPWHLRYLGPDLAAAVYESGLTYDEYCARSAAVSANGCAYLSVGLASSCDFIAGGAAYSLPAYRVGGSAWCRLEDIAALLSGTPLAFDIAADSLLIRLLPGQDYFSGAGSPPAQSTPPGYAENMAAVGFTLECNGMMVDLAAYMTGDALYVRLEHIALILGLSVTYDASGAPVLNAAADSGEAAA